MAEPSQSLTFNAYKQLIAARYDDSSRDIRFVFAADKEILAHRQLLSALSTVFGAMFGGNWQETNATEHIGTVHIKDAAYTRFNEFLAYFYTNEVLINKNNARDLVYLAKKYAVDDVAERCVSYMADNVSAYHVLGWLDCALQYDFAKLTGACLAFMGANTTLVLGSDAFVRCEMEILAQILCLKTIDCSEGELFDECIRWAEARCGRKQLDGKNVAHIRQELGACLRLIRVNEMDFKALCDRQQMIRGLYASDELCSLQWQVFKNPANVNRRLVKGAALHRPYTYAFPSNGLKFFAGNATVVKFSVSKALLLSGIQLPGVHGETTSRGLQPLPFQYIAEVQVRCEDPSVATAYRRSDACSLLFGPSTNRSGEAAFVGLPTKLIIQRKSSYEISVVIEQNQFKAMVAMNAFHAKDRVCRSIRLHVDSGDEPTFVGGLRFEEIDTGNLEHYAFGDD